MAKATFFREPLVEWRALLDSDRFTWAPAERDRFEACLEFLDALADLELVDASNLLDVMPAGDLHFGIDYARALAAGR